MYVITQINRKGCDESMNFRHEWKHEINFSDLMAVRQRLRAVAEPDGHASGGTYQVRSLYFDDPADHALRAKLDGLNRREKFRLRYYDRDLSLIRLEKKSKLSGLCSKQSAILTQREVQALLDGDYRWMTQCDLLREFHSKLTGQLLRPRTIVDYMREPYVYGPGNVRVTLDYDIRTGLGSTDFLNPDCLTIPARDAPIILEVKWDAFLPSVIQDAIQLEGRHAAAFSKYAVCRVYG